MMSSSFVNTAFRSAFISKAEPSTYVGSRVDGQGFIIRKKWIAATYTTEHDSRSGGGRRNFLFSSITVANSSVLLSSASSSTEISTSLPFVPPGKPLAAGLTPSAVVKGCWQLAGGHRGDKSSDRTNGKEAVDDFEQFVAAGITTFDTADIYGPSESLIGDYVQKHGRNGLQILTKHCVFSPSEMASPSLQSVERSINRSLSNLRLPSLDLVQFYWSDYNQPNYVQTALYLAELQARGKILNIGVTNFDTKRLKEIVDSGVKVVSSQVQYSLLDTRAENGHSEYCQANNIALLPFGTVAGSFLTDKYVGMSFAQAQKAVKIDTYSKSKYLSVLSKVGGWEFLQRLLSALRIIADKHSTSVANVASRWVLQRPQVAAVIIGARNARHVNDHRQMFSFALDAVDLGMIDAVIQTNNRPAGDIYDWERGGVF